MVTVTAFRPGLWLIERAHDDFDVRGAVIVGETRAVVWDTLTHPHDMKPVGALVQGKPLTVIYSHADWDHAWGTAGLQTAGSWIIGHEACRDRFAEEVPRELQAQQAAQPGVWDAVVLCPPTLTFQQQMTLDLGGVSLNLHHLPGHTPDTIVGFIPEWGILLAGDAVETPLPFLNPGSRLEPWITALQHWAADPHFKTVIPAHGEVGGPALLRHNLDYLQALRAQMPIALPDDLPPFYRQTHQDNLRYAQQQG